MTKTAFMFSFATLTPIPLILFGAFFGGIWIALSVIYLTVFTFSLDRLVTKSADPRQPTSEFHAADGLSSVLAVAHFILLITSVWAISSNSVLDFFDRLGLFVAAGLFFGHVSNSNAHELIHRTNRRLFNLGKWVYISLLYGHHTSAHPLVHHRFVASDYDPCSAAKGESFYRFALHAWAGSARAGYEIESQIMKLRRTQAPILSHPYISYVLGGIASIAIATAIGGAWGMVAFLGLAGYAQLQILLSDYVQHYGLRRTTLANGKLEPTAMHHSWNAPHWFSNFLMLAAPRHSDHHANPARAYPDLRLPAPEDAPTLPRSLPVMAMIALVPRLWFRIMNPRVAIWEEKAQLRTQQESARRTAIDAAVISDPLPKDSFAAGNAHSSLANSKHVTYPNTDFPAGRRPPAGRNPNDSGRV